MDEIYNDYTEQNIVKGILIGEIKDNDALITKLNEWTGEKAELYNVYGESGVGKSTYVKNIYEYLETHNNDKQRIIIKIDVSNCNTQSQFLSKLVYQLKKADRRFKFNKFEVLHLYYYGSLPEAFVSENIDRPNLTELIEKIGLTALNVFIGNKMGSIADLTQILRDAYYLSLIHI